MKNIWLFRLAAFLLLFNAFLVSSKLPNGLLSAKELGLWFGIGLTCILVFLKIRSSKAKKFNIKLIDIMVIAFLILWPLISSVNQDINNTQALLNQIALGLSYLVFRILAIPERPVFFANAVIESCAVLLFFQLILAQAQYFGLLPSYHAIVKVTGMFFNPAPFAIFIVMLNVMAWGLFLNHVIRRNYFYAVFYGVLFVTASYFVITSHSRSAWLGGLGGLLLSSFLICRPYLKSELAEFFLLRLFRNKLYNLILFVLLLLIPFCYWLYQFKENSAFGRLLTWKVTGLMIKDHWFTGVGTGNFAANYVGYQADFFNQNITGIKKYGNIAGDNRYAFNDALEVFAERGIVGLLLFIAIFILCGRAIFRLLTKHQQKASVLLLTTCSAAILVAFVIAGFTSYPLTMLPIGLLLWFVVSVLASLDPGEGVFNLQIKSKFRTAFAFVILLIGISYLFFVLKTLKAYEKWGIAMKIGIPDTRRNELLILYDDLNTHPEYLSDLSAAYLLSDRYTECIPILKQAIKFSPYKEFYYDLGTCYEASGNYELAKLQYTKIQNAIPNLLRPRYLLAKMCYARGDFKSFEKLANNVIAFVPKANSNEVDEMKREIADLLQNFNQNQ